MEITATRRRLLAPWALTVIATAVSTYALDARRDRGRRAARRLAAARRPRPLARARVPRRHLRRVGRRACGRTCAPTGRCSSDTGTSTNALSKAAHDLTSAAGPQRPRTPARVAGRLRRAPSSPRRRPTTPGAFGAALVTRLRLRHRRAHLPRRREPRRRRLRVRARPRSPARACAGGAARVVRHRLGAGRVPRRLLPRGRAGRAARRSPTSSTRCATPSRAGRSCSSASGRPCTTCSWPRRTASELHLADYLPANLAEIERWLERDPRRPRLAPVRPLHARVRGLAGPTDAQVTEREELTRTKITRLLQVDARRPDPSRAALRDGDQRLLRRLGDRRPRHLGDVHAAHLRAGRARRRCSSPPRCAAAAPTWSGASASRAPTSTSTTSARCSSRGFEPQRLDRGPRARRARGAGLLGHRARLAPAAARPPRPRRARPPARRGPRRRACGRRRSGASRPSGG